MRILLVHRYFWPDTPPYAAMLRRIGSALVDQGHQVAVFSSQPTYKPNLNLEKQPGFERIDGMDLHRVTLPGGSNPGTFSRVLNVFLFPLRLFFFVLNRSSFDVVMCSTAPPVVLAFFLALAARLKKSRFVYHCMDIHPELGRLSGDFRHPVLHALLLRIDNWTCLSASSVVVLSEEMKDALTSRQGLTGVPVSIINNFSLPGYEVKVGVNSQPSTDNVDLLKNEGMFRVLFAGNLGRFQGLEVLIDAMRLLSDCPEIELVFMGDGKQANALKKIAGGLANVRFLPHQPINVAREIIADADLGVVSLAKDVYRYAYPSKTMTYLDEGCPVLVSVERTSSLAREVETEDIGIWVEPGDARSLADGIRNLSRNPEKLHRLKSAARRRAGSTYTDEAVIPAWIKLFAGLGKS